MNKHNRIYCCDALAGIRRLATGSVQCCITSPPYFGLRDYAARGQIGMEKSPMAYLNRLLAIFAELWRVLAPNGTLWLNLGDTYWSGRRIPPATAGVVHSPGPFDFPERLPAKSLLGIPWRIALALQHQGWILRQDIIWAKKNAMPESVRDRCTKSHEYLFMFVKQKDYYFDASAIKTPALPSSIARMKRASTADIKYISGTPGSAKRQHLHDPRPAHSQLQQQISPDGQANCRPARPATEPTIMANRRSVWHLPASYLKEQHFAAFPMDIPTLCIKAGSQPGDLILDMFMGSGTTALAAIALGRRFIGFDINRQFVKMACSRISKAIKSKYRQPSS